MSTPSIQRSDAPRSRRLPSRVGAGARARKCLLCAPLLLLGWSAWADGAEPATVEERSVVLPPGVDGITNPKLIRKEPPIFPFSPAKAKMEGNVILQAVIRKDGSVGDVEVLRCRSARRGKNPDKKSMPYCRDFQAAAIDAVRRWRYEPATRDGKPVAAYFTVVIDFTKD